LAVTAGADFVGRGTVFHANLLDGLIEKAIRKRGFSVVEVMSNCHTHFGRRNEMRDPVTMMKWLRDHAVSVEKLSEIEPDSMGDKFTIGVLADSEKPIYTEEYQKIRDTAEKMHKG
jgi:2-oxoglutarate ferredoxin oxidoreductase subunit beta